MIDLPGDILQIRTYPDEILRKKSRPVKSITVDDLELLDNMVVTMRASRGVGLSAVQVGVRRQLIVVDVGEGVIKLANPEIVEAKGSDNISEGCLSFPEISIDIERADKVVIRALNEKGKPVKIKAGGLMARALQHEIDHLGGKLIIDYAVPVEKIKIKKKLDGKS